MIISETLETEGYEVITADDGLGGLKAFQTSDIDLIIADIMMPNMDGVEMTRAIRAQAPHIPLIFLTAKSELSDLVEGFEAGGDDYLKKPFKMTELLLRIKALLRRAEYVRASSPAVYRIGEYTFNHTAMTLSRESEVRQLSHFEAELLCTLCLNEGRNVTYAELMENLWSRDDACNRNSLHGFIHKLRNYLSQDEKVSLMNCRSIGYRLTINR